MQKIDIQVRYASSTYYARALGTGKAATCTMGEECAAKAVAQKVFGGKPFTLEPSAARLGTTHFTATGQSKC